MLVFLLNWKKTEDTLSIVLKSNTKQAVTVTELNLCCVNFRLNSKYLHLGLMCIFSVKCVKCGFPTVLVCSKMNLIHDLGMIHSQVQYLVLWSPNNTQPPFYSWKEEITGLLLSYEEMIMIVLYSEKWFRHSSDTHIQTFSGCCPWWERGVFFKLYVILTSVSKLTNWSF